jgi:hypothetical protein
MPKSKGRKPRKAPPPPPPRQPAQAHPQSGRTKGLIEHFWAIVVGLSVILTIVGAAFLFLPRVNIDAERTPNFSSGLPATITVTNTGSVTLRSVDVAFALCHAISNTGGKITGGGATTGGGVKCNGSAQGPRISPVLPWQGHTLVVDEKWTLTPPRYLGFPSTDRLVDGDVDFIVTFWSWPIPWYRHKVEFRFATQPQQNGTLIWAPIPID